MRALEWLNAYGPIGWAFAAAGVILALSLIALGVARVRYALTLRWLKKAEARRRALREQIFSIPDEPSSGL